MVALALCPSCQWGDHEGHITQWNPAPPGVFGGQNCPCEGDCTDKMGPMIKNLFKSFAKPVDPDEPNRSCIQ